MTSSKILTDVKPLLLGAKDFRERMAGVMRWGAGVLRDGAAHLEPYLWVFGYDSEAQELKNALHAFRVDFQSELPRRRALTAAGRAYCVRQVIPVGAVLLRESWDKEGRWDRTPILAADGLTIDGLASFAAQVKTTRPLGDWTWLQHRPGYALLRLFFDAYIDETLGRLGLRSCRVCGCTDNDCRGCVAATGHACHWVEPDLCSACKGG